MPKEVILIMNDDTQGQGGTGGGAPQWDQPAAPASDVPAEPAVPAQPAGETPVSEEPTTPEPAPMPETGNDNAGGEPVVGDEGTNNGPSAV